MFEAMIRELVGVGRRRPTRRWPAPRSARRSGRRPASPADLLVDRPVEGLVRRRRALDRRRLAEAGEVIRGRLGERRRAGAEQQGEQEDEREAGGARWGAEGWGSGRLRNTRYRSSVRHGFTRKHRREQGNSPFHPPSHPRCHPLRRASRLRGPSEVPPSSGDRYDGPVTAARFLLLLSLSLAATGCVGLRPVETVRPVPPCREGRYRDGHRRRRGLRRGHRRRRRRHRSPHPRLRRLDPLLARGGAGPGRGRLPGDRPRPPRLRLQRPPGGARRLHPGGPGGDGGGGAGSRRRAARRPRST